MLKASRTIPASHFLSLVKRFGFAGFMFFFLKGMAWLSIPALLALLN